MVSLTNLHTFGLSSHAQNIYIIKRVEQLDKPFSQPFVILGEGSNSVFTEDFEGTIVKVELKGIEHSQTSEHHELVVAAGENWHGLVCWSLAQGIGGLENLALIPGTVGAAPIQNIGAYGREVAEFIVKVEYFDLVERCHKSLTNEQCEFGYRDSIFKRQLANKVVITRVHMRFAKNYPLVSHYGELSKLVNPTARMIFDNVIAIRQQKLPDPVKIGNAGSFFKNPVISDTQYTSLQQHYPEIPGYAVNGERVKVPAAWLIDQLGFKGKQFGHVACHHLQPLVLINTGGGKGDELLALARQIKQGVQHRFNIDLEHEVRLYGRRGAIQL